MSAVKKIMKALGFAKKVTHPHLSIVKRPGEEGAKIVGMPERKYRDKKIVEGNAPAVTIVIDITH